MYNWSVDEEKFKKRYPKKYKIWRIAQLINYGLDGEKLDKKEVKKYWREIKPQLDPNKALYIKYLLWGKKPSSNQFILNFWKKPIK
jgi:hypothetical protein